MPPGFRVTGTVHHCPLNHLGGCDVKPVPRPNRQLKKICIEHQMFCIEGCDSFHTKNEACAGCAIKRDGRAARARRAKEAQHRKDKKNCKDQFFNPPKERKKPKKDGGDDGSTGTTASTTSSKHA